MIGLLKSRCRFASQVERKFEAHWNLLETQNKELVAASEKLITGVKFRLRRILGCVRSLRVVQEIGHFFSFLFQRLFAMKAELPVLPMFLVSSFSFQEVEKEIFVSLGFRRNCANPSIA